MATTTTTTTTSSIYGFQWQVAILLLGEVVDIRYYFNSSEILKSNHLRLSFF